MNYRKKSRIRNFFDFFFGIAPFSSQFIETLSIIWIHQKKPPISRFVNNHVWWQHPILVLSNKKMASEARTRTFIVVALIAIVIGIMVMEGRPKFNKLFYEFVFVQPKLYKRWVFNDSDPNEIPIEQGRATMVQNINLFFANKNGSYSRCETILFPVRDNSTIDAILFRPRVSNEKLPIVIHYHG